jgi:energy-coupling factor transporter transmembrane protein EcfT
MHHINTSTQLILFLLFALAINAWGLNAMMVLMLVFLLLLTYFKNNHFYRLMKRLKWFYLIMFLIFVFNTSGQHIHHWPFSFKPTYEGLELGLVQMVRIGLVLAALSIILTQNTKQQLISGLYFLMKPLSYLGLDTQRFSARLWLTLHYVELKDVADKDIPMTEGLAKSLSLAFVEDEEDDVVIELANPIFTWLDYIAILLMLLIVLITFLS